MQYSNLNFIRVEKLGAISVLVTDTEEKIQSNAGDCYLNCTFICECIEFKHIQFDFCTFEAKEIKLSFCMIYSASVTSKICEIINSQVSTSIINSHSLNITNSDISFCKIKPKAIRLHKVCCDVIDFFYDNRNQFYSSLCTFVRCKINGSRLLSVQYNGIFVYTDNINVWAGCQIFSIKLVKKYINDEKRLFNLAYKLEIDNINDYVKAIKLLLNLE